LASFLDSSAGQQEPKKQGLIFNGQLQAIFARIPQTFGLSQGFVLPGPIPKKASFFSGKICFSLFLPQELLYFFLFGTFVFLSFWNK
jgi:hypothetical protein